MPMLDADASTFRVVEELKRVYKLKVLPLEKMYHFESFYSIPLTDEEFESKPQVLILGMYSVGKTSFLRYLTGADIPGQKIGPEPTSDKFTVIMHGRDNRTLPGNTLALKKDMPYKGLEKFGSNFLNKFEGAQVSSEALRSVHLVDTPGILSGEKQTTGRDYNYVEVVGWFATRSDMIIIMFDTLKLDLCDELKDVITSLKPHQDKIRCVLNKADQVDKQRLLRAFGALMWNLGKIIHTPEVVRVYVGSFWDQPPLFDDNQALLQAEQADLMRDIRDLPRHSTVRRISELVRRIRLCKVHCYIIGYIKDSLPTFGKQKKLALMIDDMENIFRAVQTRYNLNQGDFPAVDEFQRVMRGMEVSMLSALKLPLIDQLDVLLEREIPRLMESLPGVTEGASDAEGAPRLRGALETGLKVIKHGRKGGPKERILMCNTGVTRLYWCENATDPPDESRSISLREVLEIRRANDPDPDKPGLVGTEVLRRHTLKPFELDNTFSLVLRERSLDIQCKNNDDYLLLFSNLQRQIVSLKNALKASSTSSPSAPLPLR